jgi:hypothetical protein
MKLLLTGGCGFIGSAVGRFLPYARCVHRRDDIVHRHHYAVLGSSDAGDACRLTII